MGEAEISVAQEKGRFVESILQKFLHGAGEVEILAIAPVTRGERQAGLRGQRT